MLLRLMYRACRRIAETAVQKKTGKDDGPSRFCVIQWR